MQMFLACVCLMLIAASTGAQQHFEVDTIPTSKGELAITFIGHGTLMFSFNGKIIHVDPSRSRSRLADYAKLPKADIILVTHEHLDHLDTGDIARLRKDDTVILYTQLCSQKLKGGTVMKNGNKQTVKELEIEAVPAYNIQHKRDDGNPFHPKGDGNGYIITFGDKRVYVAGDTENTSEMKALKNIAIAFLPMNLPYTMTPEMVADAARAFKPAILYPYHYGETDASKLTDLLKNERGIDVRIRKMK